MSKTTDILQGREGRTMRAILTDKTLSPSDMAHLLSCDDDGVSHYEKDPRTRHLVEMLDGDQAQAAQASDSGQGLTAQSTSDEGPRSFSSITAAKRAEFISYREAITKLAEGTGDSRAAVAAGLKSLRFHTDHMAYLAGPAQVVTRGRRSNDLEALLDETITSGEIRTGLIEWDDLGDSEEVDPDLFGWMRDGFIANLVESGLPSPETLKEPSTFPSFNETRTKQEAGTASRVGEARRDSEDTLRAYLTLDEACKEIEQRLGKAVSVEDMLRHAADNTIMLYWDISSLKLKGVRHRVPEDLDGIDENDDDDVVVTVPHDIYEIHFDGLGTPDYFLALANGDASQWPSRSPVIVAPTIPEFHWELRERNLAIPASKHLDDDYLPGSRVPRIAELRVDLETLDEFDDMETVDGVGPQDLADMVEIQNNERCIDWEFWVAKMPVWTATQAVRLMAALEPELFTDLSTQRNDSAGAAKEQARRLERLAVAHHIAEATPAEWLAWADGLREPVHSGFRIALAEATAVAKDTAGMKDCEQPAMPPAAGGLREAPVKRTEVAAGNAADTAEANVGSASADGLTKRERIGIGARDAQARSRENKAPPMADDGVPRLEMAANSRAAVEKYVLYQAKALYERGDTKENLTAKILSTVQPGCRGERREITAESILRMIPAGITGGRARNGRKSVKS